MAFVKEQKVHCIGSVVKAVRPGEHHRNVINFTKLKVYNIDVTNFDLDGVCDILYIQKVV